MSSNSAFDEMLFDVMSGVGKYMFYPSTSNETQGDFNQCALAGFNFLRIISDWERWGVSIGQALEMLVEGSTIKVVISTSD
jgi:hypothetical protein